MKKNIIFSHKCKLFQSLLVNLKPFLCSSVLAASIIRYLL